MTLLQIIVLKSTPVELSLKQRVKPNLSAEEEKIGSTNMYYIFPVKQVLLNHIYPILQDRNLKIIFDNFLFLISYIQIIRKFWKSTS